jgi:hypothetical protein
LLLEGIHLFTRWYTNLEAYITTGCKAECQNKLAAPKAKTKFCQHCLFTFLRPGAAVSSTANSSLYYGMAPSLLSTAPGSFALGIFVFG